MPTYRKTRKFDAGKSSRVFYAPDSNQSFPIERIINYWITVFSKSIKFRDPYHFSRRLVDDSASRQIRTFIHQVDSSRSSELEISLGDKIERTDERATLYSNEFESDISTQDATSVPQSQSGEESSDEGEETEQDQEVEFSFSSAPLSCNQNVTAHNASMALFGVVAMHCLPDEALYDLLKWHKILHPQDNLPAPNFIKNETRKLTDRYIKGTEANGSREVIFFLSFADKIQEKIEKYINEILAYANPDTKTDLKLADLFDGNTVTFKLILNTDGVRVQESSDCSAYPVWVALADLPPKLRASFDNIFLCSLWYGKGSIHWDSIFEHYSSEISKNRKIKVNGGGIRTEVYNCFCDTGSCLQA